MHLKDNGDIDAAIGSDGTIWAIGSSRRVFRFNGVDSWDLMRNGDHIALDVDTEGRAWVVSSDQEIWRWNGTGWDDLPGKATDIGVSRPDVAWVVGQNGGIFRWVPASGTWALSRSGSHIAVDASPTGSAIAIKSDNTLWQSVGGQWSQASSLTAIDVSIDVANVAWIVRPSGTTVRRKGGKWDEPASASVEFERIDAASATSAWSVDATQGVRVLDGTSWLLQAQGKDVSVGPDGTVWMVNSAGELTRRVGSSFQLAVSSGGYQRVDAGPGGVWLVNAEGAVWRYAGGVLTQRGTGAKDIAVGADGTVYMAHVSGEVRRWVSGLSWIALPGVTDAVEIAVDPEGMPLVVSESKRMYRYTGVLWREMDGGALDISVGSDGTVWIVTGSSKKTYREKASEWNSWKTAPAQARRISIARENEPLLVDADGAFWLREPYGLVKAKHISVHDDPADAWAVSKQGNLVHWQGDSWEVVRHGAFSKVEVGVGGIHYVLDDAQRIYRYDANTDVLTLLNGKARDIGVGGPNNAVWIIGSAGDIWERVGSSWVERRTDSHLAVDVGPDGAPWCVTANNDLLSWTGSSWVTIETNLASDVSLSAEGDVWVITSANGDVKTLSGSTWVRHYARLPGDPIASVSGAPGGRAAIVTANGDMMLL